MRDSPGHTRFHEGPTQCFVESGDIIDVESIEPPMAVLSDIVDDSAAAGGVSSAFLPQPAAKDARASAISARAKSLRIVCTFTSSHAAAPVNFMERPCFSIKSGTQKKTPLDASGVGPNSR